ncbi:MAG: hypothetical protein CL920_09040 [Deltaproteobacteria bacterium]|nr:hypothetical protein [Deltaproteobacteria bacterium]|tara:strand:+ start:22870 stop:24042 length:1173 start_codon:yes stop_codon:yes gene_type:complete
MELDWLIVGGGIHGVHIAARLVGEADISPEKLRIVDPGSRLLERWRDCTETTGMSHLRSPAVHHLDLDPWSLQHFGGKRKGRARSLFAYPYNRPALSLFNLHSDQVIERFGLEALHIQDRVVECSVGCGGVDVELLGGAKMLAQNVVLAIGAGDQPRWPEWAPRGTRYIQHVFEAGFDGWPTEKESVVVVGGGISGGQVALRLLNEGHEVHLVSRHALRQHQFDSEPGWLGPKLMTDFYREKDVNRRRVLISEARYPGSVPPDLRRALRRAIEQKRLSWYQSEVDSVKVEDGGLQLQLATGMMLEIQRVLLATGFSSRRPGGDMLEQLITSASLPCARCGYPVVDKSLRWHPRIFVSGPLAELELGPTARNISGARKAGDRLVKFARSSI